MSQGKRITCPELCGAVAVPGGPPVLWGLVEYLEDIVLQRAVNSLSLVEMVLRILQQTRGLRGAAQVGKPICITSNEHEMLCSVIDSIKIPLTQPDRLWTFGICNLAIKRAAECSEEDVPRLSLSMSAAPTPEPA
jgi:hypothetical protein